MDDARDGEVAEIAAFVDAELGRLTLEQKVGQLFVTQIFGSDADAPDGVDVARNREDFGLGTAAEVVAKYHLGGIAYFVWAGNVAGPAQVAALSAGLQRASAGASGVPLLISADQEQGAVVRLGPPFTELPGSMALGASGDEEDAYRAAAVTGTELLAAGINQDFAPDADVNVNPRNPVIGVRSFGADPGLVARLAVAQVRGFREAGVVSTAKHFPGHGDTEVDSHVGVPVIDRDREEWASLHLPPFRALADAGVDSIMTAHIVVPALDPTGDPATLSRPIVTGVLREELGFDGVVITDSLRMRGVREKYGDERIPVLALLAGVDQLLMPPDLDLAYQAVLTAVGDGELTEERIDASVARVLRLKRSRGLYDRTYPQGDEVGLAVGAAPHAVSAYEITDRTTTLLRDDPGLIPVPDGSRILVLGATGTAALARELALAGASAEGLDSSAAPSAAVVADAVTATRDRDLVVVLVDRIWHDDRAAQRDLVAAVLATGVPTVVAAVRDPYDLAFVDAPTCLATYAGNAVAMRSLARVLVGAIPAAGVLPVAVPEAGEPDRVRYPAGHGRPSGRG